MFAFYLSHRRKHQIALVENRTKHFKSSVINFGYSMFLFNQKVPNVTDLKYNKYFAEFFGLVSKPTSFMNLFKNCFMIHLCLMFFYRVLQSNWDFHAIYFDVHLRARFSNRSLSSRKWLLFSIMDDDNKFIFSWNSICF